MQRALTVIGFATLSLAVYGRCAAQTAAVGPPPLEQWGEETLANIQRDFWRGDLGLYRERVGGRRNRRPAPAYMWSAGVQLSALADAARIEPEKHSAALITYADALDRYWQANHNGLGGYDVLPLPKDADRYYDDNAWIVLALVETYDVTREPKYLDRAADTLRFVLSGEDEQLGGGVYWRENERTSKNTCSNAPAVVAALRLFQHTQQPQHREAARRIYDWTSARLQDGEDGLFWDNVRLDGAVDRRKFTYNSALMIRANCLLYQLDGDNRYLAEAQRIARAAETRWVDSDSGAVRDTGKFAHMLLEAFLAVHRLDRDPRWRAVVERSLVFIHDKLRDANGRYPSRWDRPSLPPPRSYQLIDQASVARAYFVAAQALHHGGD